MLAKNSVESEDGPASASAEHQLSPSEQHDGEDIEDEHHQAKLTTTQRATISLVAPQLLNNVPHPWCVFLFLLSLNVAAFSGLVWFVYIANCPTTQAGLQMMNLVQWERILTTDSFSCMRLTGSYRFGTFNSGTAVNVDRRSGAATSNETWTGTGTRISGAVRKSDGKEPGDLKGPGRVTRGLAVGRRLYLDLPHFVPCIPQTPTETTAHDPSFIFLSMYFNVTGDRKLERLWCPGWSPAELRATRYPNIEECVDSNTLVRGYLNRADLLAEPVTEGSFLHDLLVWPLVYEQKNCPKLMSALGKMLMCTRSSCLPEAHVYDGKIRENGEGDC